MENWGAIIYNTERRLKAGEVTLEQAIRRVETGLSHLTRGSIAYRKVSEYLKQLRAGKERVTTKTYRIQNRITKEWWDGEAESAQEACQKAGWLIGDCWVRERTPMVSDPTAESGHRGGGWKAPSDAPELGRRPE